MFSGDCTGEIPEIIMEGSKYIHASGMLIKIQRPYHYGKIGAHETSIYARSVFIENWLIIMYM